MLGSEGRGRGGVGVGLGEVVGVAVAVGVGVALGVGAALGTVRISTVADAVAVTLPASEVPSAVTVLTCTAPASPLTSPV